MRQTALLFSIWVLCCPISSCGPKVPPGGGPAWSGPIRESALVPTGPAPAPLPEALFQTDIPLVFTLEADFRQLRSDRGQESVERPGRVYIHGGDGEISFPVEVRTRGRFRLNDYICSFPPLRVDFPSDSVAGTVLNGLDKVKLVTHCQDKDSYEQNVLEEYLAYRMFGLLTDVGFRVQLALITYRDVSEEGEEWSRLAFLIEDEEALAQRLGGEIVEAEGAHPFDFMSWDLGLMYLYQYLIGNTDWSIVGLHNMKVLRVAGRHYAIPYDFDMSGFVNAPYAGPSPVVARHITKVRDRHFWGICSDGIDYEALFSHFNDRRGPILDLVRNQQGLKAWNAQLAASYVEEFYDTINDERDADFKIVNGCRPVRG